MKYIIGTFRAFIAAVVMLFYLTRMFIRAKISGNLTQAGYIEARSWGEATTKVLGAKLDVKGAFPAEKGLILSNHRTFCDIFVIYGLTNCCFVGMKEIENWLLIGWAAKAVNSILVDRKDPESRHATSLAIKDRLKKGFSVTVFPEGGTSLGPEIKPLRYGTFKIAAENQIPIIPVAIEYEYLNQGWGEEGFLAYFFRIFGSLKPIRAKVRIGEPLRGQDFESLVQQMETWLTQNLAEMRAEWGR